MSFRYEIWKFKDSELPDGDVFDINNYEYFKTATPNDSNFSLQVAKYKEEVFYRVSSSGSLLFTGSDYSDIIDITSDCVSYLILLFDEFTASRSPYIRSLFFNKADWIGFIRKRSVVFDYDRCSVTLEPDVFDTYTKILRGYEDKKNIFDFTDREYVKGIYFEGNIETFTRERTSVTEPDPLSDDPIVLCDEDGGLPIAFNRGTRISLKYSKAADDNVYNITETYAREFKYINKNQLKDTEVTSCVPFSPHGWVVPDLQQPIWWDYLPTIVKVIRPILGYKVSDLSYTKIDNAYYLDLDPALMWGKRRGIKVTKLLSAFRNELEGLTDVTSYILNSSTNPLTNAENAYKHLILMQQSDVSSNSDAATKFELSLKDVFDILSIMNIKWYINSSRKMVVEHVKFFENGGYYTQPANIPYLYKLPDNASRRLIKYKDDMPPQKESFTQPFSLYKDFVGYDITYPQGCSGDETIEYNFNVTTDVNGLIVSNPSEIPPSGAVLLHTKEETTSYIVNGTPIVIKTYTVQTYPTPVANPKELLNGALAMTVLHSVFWRNGRYVETGKMNDVSATFDSIVPQLVRDDVPIKIKYNQINPLLKIITELGDAHLFEAEFNIKNCIWNSTIEYAEVNG